MIFVTVGTHEQPFDRLVQYIDEKVKEGKINDIVKMQIGYCKYSPKFCEWTRFLPFDEMRKCVEEANIVITHGGPSSFILALQYGKVPIVVPRRAEYHEHINNHQVEFVNTVAKRKKNIMVVNDIDELQILIDNYEEMISHKQYYFDSNNEKFNQELEKIVQKLVKT